jgi:hypothetical protein
MMCNRIRLSALFPLLCLIATSSCGEETASSPEVSQEVTGSPDQVSTGTTSNGSNIVANTPSPVAQPSVSNTASVPAASADKPGTSAPTQPTVGAEDPIDGEVPENTPPATEPEVDPSEEVPCEVREILSDGCLSCHSASLAFGAPMSLETYADLMAPALTDPSRSVYELVLERVQDSASPMPPVPYERLDASQVQALSNWEDAGFPTSDETCELTAPEAPEEDPFENLPTGDRCSIQLDLTANIDGGGYPVPMEDDHYHCFYFDAPDTDVLQVTGWAPIIDDERTLHHWLLYYTTRTDVVAGGNEACSGVHPEDTLLGGWAPGGETQELPEDVGLRVEPGPNTRIILELHYNNVARHTDSVDQSGVRLCATSTPQKNEAATHWLGTENIFLFPGGETEGTTTCTPTEEVNILSISPHMHLLGTHASMRINRADGTQEMLLDEPFSFDSQIGYNTPTKLMPGDTLTSTCTWNNTTGGLVGFGSASSAEMCYLFTIAYPIGALNTGGDLLGGGLIGGVNKCMR